MFFPYVFIVEREMTEEEIVLKQLYRALFDKTTDSPSVSYCTLRGAAITVAIFHSYPKFIIELVKNKGCLSVQLLYLESVVKAMKEYIAKPPPSSCNTATKNSRP